MMRKPIEWTEAEERALGALMFAAAKAYDAYGLVKGGLTYDGKPMPFFQDTTDDVQRAWVAASVAGALALLTTNTALGESFSTIHAALAKASTNYGKE
jgi:hypothetical protein